MNEGPGISSVGKDEDKRQPVTGKWNDRLEVLLKPKNKINENNACPDKIEEKQFPEQIIVIKVKHADKCHQKKNTAQKEIDP